jgi:hypothetical protein
MIAAVKDQSRSGGWYMKGCVDGERGVGVGGQFGSPFCTAPIRQARSLDGEAALASASARRPGPLG